MGGPRLADLSDLLRRLDRYFDAAPRLVADAERIGPFVLFLARTEHWSYYARPAPRSRPGRRAALDAVRDRQRELGVPESFEWVADLQPQLAAAARSGGLVVRELPLMVLHRRDFRPVPTDLTVQRVRAGADLRAPVAVSELGFAHAGTAVGRAGLAQLRRAAAALPPAVLRPWRTGLADETSVMYAVRDGAHPVCVGAHAPVDGVSEIVGVATLPAYRRRGLAAALTTRLVADAYERGVRVVCLSAGSDEVARVYARVGFRRVGTLAIAEPATGVRRVG